MKSIKYIVFVFLCLFFNIFCVNAECTSDEIDVLKSKVKDIKITYKHKGIIETDDGVYDNQFDVVVKNVDSDLYISLFNGTIVLNPSDGQIISTFNNGKWKFNIYSKKCNKLIDSIDVFIPRFNKYSLDPLCEGIDGNDFALCGKYYEYDVSYDSFKERVNHYRTTHNISSNRPDDRNNKQTGMNYILDYIIDFVTNYTVYVVLSLLLLLIVLVVIIVVRKRKKRGVLE